MSIETIHLDDDYQPLDGPDHELVRKTNWHCIALLPSSTVQQKLVSRGNRLLIKPNLFFRFFCGTFLAIGLILIGLVAYDFLQGNTKRFWFLWLFGGMVLAQLASQMLKTKRKLTFDKRDQVYYVGDSYKKLAPSLSKDSGKLDSIQAIQILGNFVPAVGVRSISYTNHELNLILDDASRVQAMNSPNQESADQAAIQLGQFLGVPVWRGVSSTNPDSILK